MSDSVPDAAVDQRAWWRQLNGYHWFVFIMAILGWLFDTMDGQIFLASRSIAIKDLLGESGGDVNQCGTIVTSMFILGWAIGGLLFGSLGDKWGRAKTMAVTILVYAGFTGLSYIAQTWQEFGIYRFLTGMGVGGEFAAGASLVAEAMPEKARAKCLGLVQSLSAVGNIIGASLFWYIEGTYGWRVLYLVGAFPALIAVFVFLNLREPERWVKAKAAANAATAAGLDASKHLGSIADLFRTPRWRRNTLVGLALGISGVLGLWGVGFFSPELIDASIPMLSDETKAKIAAVVAANGAGEHQSAVAAFKQDDAAYVTLVSTRLNPPVPADKALETPLNEQQREQLAQLLAQLKAGQPDGAAPIPGLSEETQKKAAAVAKADTAVKFREAVAAFKEDERAYIALVSKWLKPADRVVSAKVLSAPKDDADAAQIKALRATAVMTPLNAAQKDEVRALIAKALPRDKMTALKGRWLILQQIGAFLGMMAYAYLATSLGRRPAFVFAFLAGWFAVAFTFYSFHDVSQLWYMAPLLGFGTLAPFGGYAMYFPELFPTRLRNTGTSFCYNVGRFVAALGPAALGQLAVVWEGKYEIESFRLAALTVSCAYAIGVITVIWAPETRNEPLPDDEISGTGAGAAPKAEPAVAH
ncbi:MAG: MFS transporter [Planctomycetota bacterium]|nr:MFS transporter [Planctomycetota bacterium]